MNHARASRRGTKRSKGIAYVLFADPADAVAAFQQLDGQIFQVRLSGKCCTSCLPPAVPTLSQFFYSKFISTRLLHELPLY